MKKLVLLIFACVNTVLFAQAPFAGTTVNVYHEAGCCNESVDTAEANVAIIQSATIQSLRLGLPVYTTGDLASIGTGGAVGKCMTCDSIRDMADSLYNSPWTYNGNTPTDVILRDRTKKVGIGVDDPEAPLHVENFATEKIKATFGGKSVTIAATNTSTGAYSSVGVGNASTIISTNDGTNTGSIGIEALLITIENENGRVALQPTIGNVGIGANSAPSKLTVTEGDIYINTIGNGIILPTPTTGQCYRLTIDDSGDWVKTLITCP